MKALGKFLVIIGILILLLNPIVGFFIMVVGLIMFLVGKDKKVLAAIEARKDQERPCPFCKEPVLKSAIKCKHCHADIPAVENEPPLNELIKIENGFWECKNCHIKMLVVGDYCSKCREKKQDVAIRK